MSQRFTAEFFTHNRQRLQAAASQADVLILTASGLVQRSNDTSFAFRQDSNFWYVTGVDEPDVIIVITAKRSYLVVPGRSDSRQVFDGSIDLERLRQVSGVDEVMMADEGWEAIATDITGSHVGIIEPPRSYLASLGLYANPARARLRRQLRRVDGFKSLIDIRPELIGLRMTKQSVELDAIKDAIALTGDALQRVRDQIDTYQHEYDVEADITAVFKRGQAGHAYEPIIASGKNACTLHYIQNDSSVRRGDLLLMDVGAEVSNYAADITRTVAIGKPSKRQQEVYNAVLEMQQYAYDQLQPGITIRDYEQRIEKQMGVALKRLGLITSSNRSDIRHYYPHATSHFLGLDVHDAADYSVELTPGMVLTVEPGIYIPEEGVGIRIEDDVVISGTGVTILSENLPRQLA